MWKESPSESSWKLAFGDAGFVNGMTSETLELAERNAAGTRTYRYSKQPHHEDTPATCRWAESETSLTAGFYQLKLVMPGTRFKE